jgi:hypothetical protein
MRRDDKEVDNYYRVNFSNKCKEQGRFKRHPKIQINTAEVNMNQK